MPDSPMTAPAAMPSEGQIIEPDDYSEYLRKEKTHGRYGYMQCQRAKAANRRADQAEARASEAEARALAAEAALAAERERCAKIADRFGNEAYATCGVSGNFMIDKAEMAQALVATSIAAAIRAQGE